MLGEALRETRKEAQSPIFKYSQIHFPSFKLACLVWYSILNIVTQPYVLSRIVGGWYPLGVTSCLHDWVLHYESMRQQNILILIYKYPNLHLGGRYLLLKLVGKIYLGFI